MFLLQRSPHCKKLSRLLSFHRNVLRRAALSSFPAGEEDKLARDQNGQVHLLRRTNPKLERYYREQGTCSTEEEWNACLAAMRGNLPQGLRINSAKPHVSRQIRRLLRSRFWQTPTAEKHNLEVREVDSGGLIWQANTDRWSIRRADRQEEEDEDPELVAFHEFLQNESEAGNVSRQELVSMAPVLSLDVKPHHKVLDMCASPGSKTKQVIEVLQGDESGEGLVVANEVNPLRCFRLSNQVHRVGSFQCALTNHDGRVFPEIYLSDGTPMRYDRIVCDQPCSGDGTLRKNPTVWSRWHPGVGNSIHKLQLDIAKRGLSLLKSGGLFAYSSCSMNPVENEAVVARLLLEADGALEVLDVREDLKTKHGLNCAPGFAEWKVFDGRMNTFPTYGEVPTRLRGEDRNFHGLYPPECSEIKENLSRCMRFLPHHNDCGGFFVSILRKKREFEWREEILESAGRTVLRRVEVPEVGGGRRWKRTWRNWGKVRFLDDEIGQSDLDFHGLSEGISPGQLYSASGTEGKIYHVSHRIREIVENNSDKVNFYAAGVPCFRWESKGSSPVRIAVSEKSGSLLPLVKGAEGRRVNVTADDFKALLDSENRTLQVKDFSERARRGMDNVSVGPVRVALPGTPEGSFECFGYKGEERLLLIIGKPGIYHLQTVLQNEAF